MALDVIDKSKDASERKVFIYGLKCPSTEQVRYIGMTCNLKSRYSRHITESKGYHKNLWIAKLKRDGLKPEMVIIDEVDFCDWEEAEKKYILLFKSFGADLTNKTVGGDITPDSRGDKNGNWGKFGSLNHKSKPVYVFTKEGVFLEEVGSMRVCSRKYNVDFSSIVRCCKGGLIKSNGFVFRYKEDFSIQPTIIDVKSKKTNPVYVFYNDGTFIEEVDSPKECCVKYNISIDSVYNSLKKKSFTTKGFFFRNKSDFYSQPNFIKIKKTHGLPISISQFDLHGNFIKSYTSIDEASLVSNVSRSAILKSLKNEVEPKKYQFKYNK